MILFPIVLLAAQQAAVHEVPLKAPVSYVWSVPGGTSAVLGMGAGGQESYTYLSQLGDLQPAKPERGVFVGFLSPSRFLFERQTGETPGEPGVVMYVNPFFRFEQYLSSSRSIAVAFTGEPVSLTMSFPKAFQSHVTALIGNLEKDKRLLSIGLEDSKLVGYLFSDHGSLRKIRVLNIGDKLITGISSCASSASFVVLTESKDATFLSVATLSGQDLSVGAPTIKVAPQEIRSGFACDYIFRPPGNAVVAFPNGRVYFAAQGHLFRAEL